MLRLFANLFGCTDDVGTNLSETQIKAAIERAVDGTDPRLRIVSGYAKRLREPVIHAVRQAIELVARLPAPIVADRRALNDHPVFSALFYSEENLEQILSRDLALKEFRAAHPSSAEPVTALSVARRNEKHGFGIVQVGDQARSDVARTTVSFSEHRLLGPAASEGETRRLLTGRAFDYVLSVALRKLTEQSQERDVLTRRRALLRSKLAILQRCGGFSRHTGEQEQVQLQSRLEAIEAELATLASAEDTLPANLATIAGVLETSERHLWMQDCVLCLDKLYVLHEKPEPSAPPAMFTELHDSEDQRVTVLLVSIPHR